MDFAIAGAGFSGAVVGRELAVQLVNPAVNADLMPFGHHPALFIGIKLGHDGRNEKA